MSEHLHRTAVTDSERAAGWAAQCMNEGRYELGLTLAKIAVQAEHVERAAQLAPLVPITPAPQPPKLTAVPSAGGTEYISRVQASLPTYTQLAELNLPDGPTGTADAEAADAHIYRTPNGVPEGQRCRAKFRRDGVPGECHGAVYWSSEDHAWVHVHSDIEADHVPVVRA